MSEPNFNEFVLYDISSHPKEGQDCIIKSRDQRYFRVFWDNSIKKDVVECWCDVADFKMGGEKCS